MPQWTDPEWIKYWNIMERMVAAARLRQPTYVRANTNLAWEMLDCAADALVACAQRAIEHPPNDKEAYLVASVRNALTKCLKHYKDRHLNISSDAWITVPDHQRRGQPLIRLPVDVDHIYAEARDAVDERIIELLKNGWTYARVAEEIGVDASTVSRRVAKLRARLAAGTTLQRGRISA